MIEERDGLIANVALMYTKRFACLWRGCLEAGRIGVVWGGRFMIMIPLYENLGHIQHITTQSGSAGTLDFFQGSCPSNTRLFLDEAVSV